MNIILKIEDLIQATLKELGYVDNVELIISGRPDLGDYQYNGSFSLAKKIS